MKKQPIIMYARPSYKEKLKKTAQAHELSISAMATKIIEEYLDNLPN